MIQLNTYTKFSDPRVSNTINFSDYINLIKNGYNVLDIERARQFDRDNSTYLDIKGNRLCLTFNFLFNDRKVNNNIHSGTGLIYFDIDDTEYNIETLDKDKVFCYHKSFGGRGWVIICKVDGLSLDNYKDTFNYIASEINISEFVDNAARKASQFTILSYDPKVFYNESSYIFSARQGLGLKTKEMGKNATYVVKNNSKYTYDNESSIFNNLFINPPNIEEDKDSNLYYDDSHKYAPILEDFIVYGDGIKVNKIKLPKRRINEGDRQKFISTTANRFLFLNEKINYDHFFNYIQSVNIFCCKNPLNINQIKEIVNYRWCNKKYIKVTPNHTRKIIFNKNFKGNKQKIVGREVGKLRRNKTMTEIYICIEDWDFIKYGKITQTKLAEITTKSRKTIHTYWGEFKDYIKQVNKENII